MPGRPRDKCPKGHAYTAENTYWDYGTKYQKPYRRCRTCKREGMKAWRRRTGRRR